MNPNGRPPILADVRKQDAIIQALADGLSQRAAANTVGVGVKTLRRFARHNPPFRARLRKATARHEAELVAIVRNAAATDPRLATWKLERANPKAYQRRPPLPFSVDDAFRLVSSIFKNACEFIVGDALQQAHSQRAQRILDVLQPDLARRLRPELQPPFWARPTQPANRPPPLPLVEPTNPSDEQTRPHPTTLPPGPAADPSGPSSDPPTSDAPTSDAPTSDPLSSDPLSSDPLSSDP